MSIYKDYYEDHVNDKDFIKVVRCKDCIHWQEWENGTGSCHRADNMYDWFGVNAIDYCSFGERIEE